MRKKFVWELWKDPIDIEDIKTTESPTWEEETKLLQSMTPVMQTHFGLLPIFENNQASKRFEFWILHTNFDITKPIIQLIDSVAGVETLEVFTRYRLRIGFPRSGLFDVRTVKQQIQKTILELDQKKAIIQLNVFDDKIANKAIELYKQLSTNTDYWGMYVVPNGHISVITTNTPTQYQSFIKQLQVFQTTQQLVGGQILSSEESIP